MVYMTEHILRAKSLWTEIVVDLVSLLPWWYKLFKKVLFTIKTMNTTSKRKSNVHRTSIHLSLISSPPSISLDFIPDIPASNQPGEPTTRSSLTHKPYTNHPNHSKTFHHTFPLFLIPYSIFQSKHTYLVTVGPTTHPYIPPSSINHSLPAATQIKE